MKRIIPLLLIIATFFASAVFAAKPEASLGKIRIAYAGGACEAPVFVAYHNGFFKAEGLEPEILQAEFDALRTGVSSGKIDASVGNFGWFKAIEQGFKVKITGGIHAGCIKFVVPKDSPIKSLADLKGKTIGIDEIGQGPQIDLSIAARSAGLDPAKDISWRAYPPPQLSDAVKKKEIDGFVVWDPFASDAVAKEGYRVIFDIGEVEPFRSGFCCFAVVSSSLLEKSPKKAAAFTRAILKAAAWVGTHPRETAELEVKEKYVTDDVALVEKLISSYYWKPSVDRAAESAKFFIHQQKIDGILEATTDEGKLYDRLFAKIIKDSEI